MSREDRQLFSLIVVNNLSKAVNVVTYHLDKESPNGIDGVGDEPFQVSPARHKLMIVESSQTISRRQR